MSQFQYTAVNRGTLMSGHSEGTEYLFDLPIASLSTNVSSEGDTQISLSGKRYRTFHRTEKQLSITTAPIHASQNLIIESVHELFMSVCAGETFEIDLGGGLQPYIIDGGLSESIIDNVFKQFSFKVVAL